MSNEAREKFDRFNFQQNEDWLRYRANLVFPAGGDEAALTEKYRQKWYQRNIDPSFELFGLASSSSSFGSSSTSSSNSSSANGAGVFEEQETPKPQARTPPSAPKIESLDGEDEPPQFQEQSNRSQSRPQQPSASAAASASSPPTWMQSAVVAGNLSVLIFGIAAVITGGASSFRLALFASVFNNLLSIIQIFGMPKLSMEYFTRISTNDNWMYIFYCFIFLAGYPLPLALAPLLIFAFYNSSATLKTLLGRFPIPFAGTLIGYIDKANQVETVQKAQMLVSNNEIITMPVLVVYLFLGYSNLIQVFLYWRFINQRYHSNHLTRLIAGALEQRIDQFTASYGVLAMIWARIKAGIRWLARIGGGPAQPPAPHQH